GRVFCLNEEGKCFVVRAGDRYELENVLRFGADEEMCMASPAMSGDRLVVRTSSRVLCLRGA
ncbi:MAG: serine/threonine protein kinase, partial [Armatimonadaceae bacterium]